MRSGRGQRGLLSPFSLTPTEGPAYNTGSSLQITHGHDDSVGRHGKRN